MSVQGKIAEGGQIAEQTAPGVSDAGRVRHVSGSLLPSNEPRILAPVEASFGTLQVRVIGSLDTHGLFHRHANGESLLATHGNGYSLFKLLERMIGRDSDGVTRQAQYILDCGGTTRNLHHIRNVIEVRS